MKSSSVVSLPFSIFVTSLISSKALHWYIHSHSISLPVHILFLPTVFLPDILLICGAWILLLGHRGIWSVLGSLLVCVLSLTTCIATAMEWGFFYTTGAELEWRASLVFGMDSSGVTALWSEVHSVFPPLIGILAISWFARPMNFTLISLLLAAVTRYLNQALRQISLYKNPEIPILFFEEDIFNIEDEQVAELPSEAGCSWRPILSRGKECLRRNLHPVFSRVKLPHMLLLVTVLLICRPEKPYNHLSNTLPVNLLGVFRSEAPGCEPRYQQDYMKWPFPDIVDGRNWELPKGDFKGWAPGSENVYVKRYRNRRVDWLPGIALDGFHRWKASRDQKGNLSVTFRLANGSNDKSPNDSCAEWKAQVQDYSPVADPLRITNLDLDLLEPLKTHLREHTATISHIIIVEMESLRKDLFPLIPGSALHKKILSTHPDAKHEAINERLERFTPNSKRILGNFVSFVEGNRSIYDTSKLSESLGGININGALTGSSLSTKSLLGSHCGVWPLPVDMLKETRGQIYQPCLPHIFNLFNAGKGISSGGSGEDFHRSSDSRDRQWKHLSITSVTGRYDSHHILNKGIGFDQTITRETLEREPHFNATPIYYFGYPERVIKPHIKKAMQEAIANDQRLFLSHFTSSTHHPWATPSDFATTKYIGGVDGDFNHYMNSIQFHDQWLGEILELVDEMGVSPETLIVFVGDHGMVFEEDDTPVIGAINNKHITNFRVPIVFHHPGLPRLEVNASATSISILPTILDLLIHTGSLNDKDRRIASDLIHEYEGQSLIRPYVSSKNGRRAWNFGIINPGGGMIAITSADTPWRMVLPLAMKVEYSFTDLERDPLEMHPTEAWEIKHLVEAVRRQYGNEAVEWVEEAEKVVNYFVHRQERLWKYVPRASSHKL